MLVIFSSGPGQSYLFSVFIDPIIEDTGLSRTVVSSLYALGTVLSATMVFFISNLADSKGPRWTLALIAFAFGAACFSMWAASGWILIAVALALLRGLGQGALPINSTLLIAQWFVRRRGRAMALYGLGGAASTAILPSIARWLIETVGWQGAYFVFGVAIWAALIPLTLLIARNTPEEMGLYPDGASEPPIGEPRVSAGPQTAGIPRRELLASKMFWLLVIPIAIPSLVDTALIFHQVDLFEQRGLSAAVAAGAFVPFAMASASSNVVAGFLVDRFGPRLVFVFAAALLVTPPLLVQIIGTPIGALGYAVIIGAGSGMTMMVSRTVWAHYYGRFGLGRVQGMAMVVTIFSSALGPMVLSILKDAFDGYAVGLAVMAALMGAAAIIMFFQDPQPVPPREQPASAA